MQATRKKNQYLVEFTGERVVPEMVEPDLWNEHLSRYLYAAGLVAGKRVLDVGCGTGYGTACLAAHAALAAGFDVAPEAVSFARQHYGKSAKFEVASAEHFPDADASFDVVTAFEVIEHLEHWQKLILEAHRVLTGDGLFLVSTPNKTYYAETRGESGPNPFHVHEFDYDEFRAALESVFPHVVILGQNRTEAFTFAAESVPAASSVDFGDAHESVAGAHFYLALCSKRPIAAPGFVFVPGTGNLLREREHHIALLERQLEESNRDRAALLGEHWRTEENLRMRTDWAQKLERDLNQALRERNEVLDRLRELEQELHLRMVWVSKVESEARNIAEQRDKALETLEEQTATIEARTAWAKMLDEQIASLSNEHSRLLAMADDRQRIIEDRTEWARRLDTEVASLRAELASLVSLLDEREKTVIERTAWAQELERRLDDAIRRLDRVRNSRWMKLGRLFGLGPDLQIPGDE